MDDILRATRTFDSISEDGLAILYVLDLFQRHVSRRHQDGEDMILRLAPEQRATKSTTKLLPSHLFPAEALLQEP